jgi:hypothetical protein
MLLPDGDRAVCPECRASEPAPRLPLFVVTGASGSGKTTVLPHLSACLPEFAVFDIDWLIGPVARASAPGPVDWAALRDAWLTVAHGVAQGGRHTVLLGSIVPDQLDDLPSRQWVTDIHFALIDCPDDVRRARLATRPAWRGSDIDEHIRFAAALRRILGTVIDTTGTPERTALRVARWVRTTCQSRRPPTPPPR